MTTQETLDRQIITYLAERLARGEFQPTTARNNRYILTGFSESFGARPLNQLGVRVVERWLATIGHLKPATRLTRWSTVRQFVLWLHRRGQITADPFPLMRAPKRPRSVPRDLAAGQVARSLNCPDVRLHAIMVVMVELGLRCCEIARLEIGDDDQTKQTMLIVGKGGHERELPVTMSARRAITAYFKSEPPAGAGPLFRFRREPGSPSSAKTISLYVRLWMAEAGVKVAPWDGISAHAFRHTAASDVLDRCPDLRVVSEMLGHLHLSTTAIYLRRAGLEKMREAMEGRSYGGVSTFEGEDAA